MDKEFGEIESVDKLEKTEKKGKASSIVFEAVSVPTQYAPAIRNNKTGDVLTFEQALVQLLNDVAEVKRAVA